MDDESSTDAKRLDALGARLREAERRHAPPSQEGMGENGSGMGLAVKYAAEFAGAVLVSTAVGYFIDRAAGTSPWGLLIGLLLGSAAGVYTMVRSAQAETNTDL